MNVLSLFDGMSCGQQALERQGIKVDNYFASEIDKYAIQVTMANYPNTVQLGSVTQVDGKALPKIDLLIGGSPCQSFSFAGKRKGMSTKDEQEILTLEHYLQLKSEGYEFEGQSYLFWEYMRLLNEVKPKYFLLENVMMGEKWEKVLSKAIGVNPIMINSSLVSAQNRQRLYWTNIGMVPGGLFGDLESIIEQPKDKGILLKDILQDEVNQKYFLSDKMVASFEKHKERHSEKGTGFGFLPKNDNDKGNCLRANAALCPTDNMIIVHNTMPRSSKTGKGGTGPLSRNDGKTYCLDTGTTNAIEYVKIDKKGNKKENQNKASCFTAGGNSGGNHSDMDLFVINGGDYRYDEGFRWRENGKTPTLMARARQDISGQPLVKIRKVNQLNSSKESGESQPYQQNRIYDLFGISPALCANKSDLIINTPKIRRLTPTECERLQTVKDGYTNYVSDTQRYKMLGNGWTVDVIAHIFSYIK